jgi:hypothetical protein
MTVVKIDEGMPDEVMRLLAESLGFQLSRDVRPGTDEWILSAGHGATCVQHAGTRRGVCAFLTGFSTMQRKTAQLLNDLERANRLWVETARSRLGR